MRCLSRRCRCLGQAGGVPEAGPVPSALPVPQEKPEIWNFRQTFGNEF